jgi:hypothetical protein
VPAACHAVCPWGVRLCTFVRRSKVDQHAFEAQLDPWRIEDLHEFTPNGSRGAMSRMALDTYQAAPHLCA